MKQFAYKIRLTLAIIVFVLTILAFTCKVYPVAFLDLQAGPLMQRVLCDFSVYAAVLLGAIFLITLLFGRFYCSTLCPFGILQEIAALIFNRVNEPQEKYPYKYFIAALTAGFMIGGSAMLIRYIEPYTTFGSMITLSVFGIILTLAVLALVFFKNRFFCANICPVGTILGLIAKFSVNKIHMDEDICISCGICSRTCPTGCINYIDNIVDNENCLKCMKCLEACPKQAMQYGIMQKKSEEEEKEKFSLNRRNLILTASAFVLLGGAIKAGLEISKKLSDKLKNVILPPGSVNESRLLSKCLNCNLCVKNCPNGIIQKGDKNFGAVHINMEKGNKHCKYDCHKCSEVCPSGAIKKLSLEEKQKTRISMAVVNEEKCHSCSSCVIACPTGAISLNDAQKAVIDSSKCIGCGKCRSVCPENGIDIFTINEQQNI